MERTVIANIHTVELSLHISADSLDVLLRRHHKVHSRRVCSTMRLGDTQLGMQTGYLVAACVKQVEEGYAELAKLGNRQ